jgi:hypothetical protein
MQKNKGDEKYGIASMKALMLHVILHDGINMLSASVLKFVSV